MIAGRLEEILLADLEALVENRVRESTSLDYKQELPGGGNEEKKEFLRDVISFANTVGGDMVFGVAERRDDAGVPTGEAERVDGTLVDNRDALTLRLETMIRTSVAPRLVGCGFRFVDLPDGRAVLVMRIPQSLAAPHMLTLQTRSPFYARNSGGKYELDVQQIRDAFSQADALSERLARFRDGRVAKVVAGDTPVPLLEGPKLVLHTMPLSGLRASQQVDLTVASRQVSYLYPPGSGGANLRYNFDGFLMFSQLRPGSDVTSTSYTQAFRNGFVEFVSAEISHPTTSERVLWADGIESDVITAVRNHLNYLSTVEISPPVYVTLSLVGIAGYSVREPFNAPNIYAGVVRQHGMDRDQLFLPEVFIEDFEHPVETALKPLFDVIWQAAGLAGSPYYDAQGNRVARR